MKYFTESFLYYQQESKSLNIFSVFYVRANLSITNNISDILLKNKPKQKCHLGMASYEISGGGGGGFGEKRGLYTALWSTKPRPRFCFGSSDT